MSWLSKVWSDFFLRLTDGSPFCRSTQFESRPGLFRFKSRKHSLLQFAVDWSCLYPMQTEHLRLMLPQFCGMHRGPQSREIGKFDLRTKHLKTNKDVRNLRQLSSCLRCQNVQQPVTFSLHHVPPSTLQRRGLNRNALKHSGGRSGTTTQPFTGAESNPQ